MTSTQMTAPVKRFSRFELTHGPSTALSLHSNSRKTVALGSSTPASVCTASVSRPSGLPGISTSAAAARNDAEVHEIEALRVATRPMQRMANLEHVADRVRGRQRHGCRADDAGVEQRHGEDARRGVRPTYFSSPAITPPASVKLPNSGVPANSAAQNEIIATAPIITNAMPIHRSAFSYFMKRGVMRLSMT